MQTIELHAAHQQDYRLPKTVEVQMISPLHQGHVNLDEELALILHIIRQSNNPGAMDALGSILAYMESMEKNQAELTSVNNTWVTLSNPVTMSL